MNWIKQVFAFFLIILSSTAVFSQTESHFLELVQNCNSEFNSRVFDGSCLILGILGLKKGNKSLHNKIENLCVDLLSENKSLSYSYYENFLVYYPKCNYIVISKIRLNKINTFDANKESEELVRFLNSH